MKSVGWVGTGVMGASMVGHILKHGYEVTVYNRTLSKCDGLKEQGASVASSPAEVAKVSVVLNLSIKLLCLDIVFGIVGYPSDVRKVFLDPEWGVLSSIKQGGVIVDMTTSEPSLAKEIYEAAKQKGVSSLDAPVSGGDVGAREGTLSIMVGGDTNTVESTMPLFEIMGKNIRHMGGAGAGQHTKMVNQILIATNMIGVVEGLLYAQKSGLDVEEAIRAVSAGAAGSWSISNLGPRIAKRNFDPGFFVEHFVKDMGIALKEAERMNLSLPGLALANQLYVAVKAQGHGRLGTQSLMLALEQLNEKSYQITKRSPYKNQDILVITKPDAMDLPEEELKQPLVAQEEASPPRPGSAGSNRTMRNPPVDAGAEEEKEEAPRSQGVYSQQQQQKRPYSAPNVHPYAVPQYQPQGYGGGAGDGWGREQDDDTGEQGITVDIVFSGMYTLAAAFTIIQGFGMLIHFTYAAVSLGFYTMAFGAAVIMYDLKSVVNGVSVEMYLPFLGNYIGRAATILFFAVLCAQTYEYAGWTKFIVLYNLLVATLQGFVYFTTKTVTPSQTQMDDLPDL
ncbi:putative 3-hydroxyisobutyrate dehydrogenase-like 1 [Phytophthora citrophthora]|uniref:3-hydroxyisobutyrate dehydrogenase-like 1 n=1 Tax=Phytophthora citrophthora TaxID=4793 RepID=A0AAD9LBZ7_9STRA|nr:putative 3-hydroxyisobutyrate dehydrogenase-like 1 [Phytophthora citrophthora]